MHIQGLFVSSGTARVYARRALTARLYAREGGLVYTIRAIVREADARVTVALLTDDQGRDHGVAVIDPAGTVMVYVHPRVRNGGWGTKLVSMVKCVRIDQTQPLHALPSVNVPAGARFWERCGVELRCHQIAPAMPACEQSIHQTHGRVLIEREARHVPDHIFESLYIAKLFESDSNNSNGIRGQLTELFETNNAPFDVILYHYGLQFESCATVTERDGRLELNLFVAPCYRRQGRGQEIIDAVKSRYPDRQLYADWTDTSRALMSRNDILPF